MANGHVPGRVNPFQQIGQTLAERQQQGLGAIQSILQGQTPQLPGLPQGGFTPNIRTLNQFKDAALAALRQTPTMDLSAFEQAFIQPLMGSSVPGQLLAMDYYTQKADITKNLGAIPQQFLAGPVGSSIDALIAQSQALSNLGQQFAHDPMYQQALAGFVGQLAPTGQVGGLTTTALAALANPYFQQVAQFGSPEAAGLPAIQFPTELQNIPQARRNVIEAIAQQALATQGQQVTPFGVQERQPANFLSELLSLGREALGALPGFNFGQPQADVSGQGFPVAGAPAPMIPTTATQPTAPPAAEPAPGQREAEALQAIQNQLSTMGASANWVVMHALTNREQLRRVLGDEGLSALVTWAQLNLPNNPLWQPPGGIDPIQALINVAGNQRR